MKTNIENRLSSQKNNQLLDHENPVAIFSANVSRFENIVISTASMQNLSPEFQCFLSDMMKKIKSLPEIKTVSFALENERKINSQLELQYQQYLDETIKTEANDLTADQLLKLKSIDSDISNLQDKVKQNINIIERISSTVFDYYNNKVLTSKSKIPESKKRLKYWQDKVKHLEKRINKYNQKINSF